MWTSVLTARKLVYLLKNFVFWDKTPCSPLKVNRRFRGTFRLSLQGRSKKPVKQLVSSVVIVIRHLLLLRNLTTPFQLLKLNCIIEWHWWAIFNSSERLRKTVKAAHMIVAVSRCEVYIGLSSTLLIFYFFDIDFKHADGDSIYIQNVKCYQETAIRIFIVVRSATFIFTRDSCCPG
jgi:hypothetical protein